MTGKPTDAELLAYAERYLGELGLSPAEQYMLEQLRDGVLSRLAGADGADGQGMAEVSEARVGNIEATLRQMDDRLSRIVEQIHQLDVRTGRLEDGMGLLKEANKATSDQVTDLAGQMRSMGAPAGYSRAYLAGGAAAMTVVILLLVVLTWRLL